MSETSTPPSKPQVVSTAYSGPYWQGLVDGELLLQICSACGQVRHYPRLLCDRCYSDQVRWHAASGRGKIHSWTVAHHAYHPGFAAELPYTLVTVDLIEGPRALGRWLGDGLTIGLCVRLRIVNDTGQPELSFECDPAA